MYFRILGSESYVFKRCRLLGRIIDPLSVCILYDRGWGHFSITLRHGTFCSAGGVEEGLIGSDKLEPMRGSIVRNCC